MRRYLLVLVTIAVVLSLALVGCVGTQPQPPQPPDGGGGDGGETPPATPTAEPADGTAFTSGATATLDWTDWADFIEGDLCYELYVATCTCTAPATWTKLETFSPTPCCPASTTYVWELNECGKHWWKIKALGSNGQVVAETTPQSILVYPTVVATLTIGSTPSTFTFNANKLEFSKELSLCDATNVTLQLPELTCCGTVTFTVRANTDVFTPDATSGNLNSVTTVTFTATTTVCSGAFEGELIKVTINLPCDLEDYELTVSGKSGEIEFGLLGGGWFYLIYPDCLTVATPTGEITIKKDDIVVNIPTASITSATSTHSTYGGRKYSYYSLDGLLGGIAEIDKGQDYEVIIPKGAFTFTNTHGTTIGWPCSTITEIVTALEK